MKENARERRPARDTFRVPLLLALVTLVGLVAALVGDGWMDWLSWAALAIPLAIGLRFALR